jgi:EAL domain-containing protein (putative c-di-GMP-specific phosphodiesterase class I)
MAQNRRWRDQGFNLTTAVNVSVVDLQDPALLDRIDDLLLKHRLPPGSLVLEITESGIMNDVDKAVALLSRMQQRGLRLSIDDYGTGYSSMAQLKRLPVHELKIDKSFILDLARNEDDAIIVRSTIELGHNMGLKIVAEGVEGAEALEMLRSFGCEYAQGYHLGRPVDAAALERWLRDCPYGVQRVGSAEGVPQ